MKEKRPFPKVSVTVLTYNHSQWLRECLDSVLSQKTSDPFEVIVGDDASTDGNQAIILEYAQRFPEVVVPRLSATNQGAIANINANHALARGEYIAFIDGDDRMLPGKLQHQVDVLDRNPDCAISTHQVRVFDSATNNTVKMYSDESTPTKSDIGYLLLNNCFFSHCSKMYRRSAVLRFAPRTTFTIDFLLHIEHAMSGKIAYSPQTFAEYRINNNGMSSNAALRENVVQGHIDGYLRATELGVHSKFVKRGLRTFLVGQALTRLKNRQFDSYLNLLNRMKDFDLLSEPRAAFLYLTRKVAPVVADLYELRNRLRR